MPCLKKIADYYIYSNIHVAISGFCMTKISLLKFGISENLTPLFVGLSIVISYNLIRFFEVRKKRLKWFSEWFNENQKYVLITSIIAGILLSYITFFSTLNEASLVILLPFVFMTFFYVIPILKIANIEISFRNFPGIKIFSISIAWAGITVFFPLFEQNIPFSQEVYTEFFQRFLFLIGIIIPFDIRDVHTDPVALKTIPQLIGIKKSKVIGTIAIVLFLLLEITSKIVFTQQIESTVLISIITLLFLWLSNPDRTRYFSSFWVESIPILWFVLFVLF